MITTTRLAIVLAGVEAGERRRIDRLQALRRGDGGRVQRRRRDHVAVVDARALVMHVERGDRLELVVQPADVLRFGHRVAELNRRQRVRALAVEVQRLAAR